MLKHKPLHQTNSGTSSHQGSEISNNSSKFKNNNNATIKKKVAITRSYGDKPTTKSVSVVTRKNSVKTGPSFDIDHDRKCSVVKKRKDESLTISPETRTSSTSTSFFLSPASSRRSITNLTESDLANSNSSDNKSIHSSSKIGNLGVASSSGYAGSNISSSTNLEHDIISSDEFQEIASNSLEDNGSAAEKLTKNKSSKTEKGISPMKLTSTEKKNRPPDVQSKNKKKNQSKKATERRDKLNYEKSTDLNDDSKKDHETINQNQKFLVPDSSSNQDSKLENHTSSLISKGIFATSGTATAAARAENENKNPHKRQKTPKLNQSTLSGSDSDSELELRNSTRRATSNLRQNTKLRKDHFAARECVRIQKSKNLQDLRSSKVLAEQSKKIEMLKYRNSGVFSEHQKQMIKIHQNHDQNPILGKENLKNESRRRYHSESSESVVSTTSSSGLASAYHQVNQINLSNDNQQQQINNQDLLFSRIEKLRTILLMLNPNELYQLIMSRLDQSYQDPCILEALTKLLPDIDIDNLMDNLSASENSESEHVEHIEHYTQEANFEQRREMQRLPIKFADGQDGFIRREKCVTTASSTSRSGRSSPIDGSNLVRTSSSINTGSNLYHLPVQYDDNNNNIPSNLNSDYHDPGMLEEQALQQLVQHTFSKMTIEDSDGTGIGTEIESITRTSSYLMDVSNETNQSQSSCSYKNSNSINNFSHTMPAKLKPTIQKPEENPRQYMEDQMANYRRLRRAHPKAKTCISDSGNKNFYERQLTPQGSCVPNLNIYQGQDLQASSSTLHHGHQHQTGHAHAAQNNPIAKKLKITHCVRCHKNYDHNSSSTVLNKCRIPHPQNLVVKLENNSNDFKCLACKKTFRLPLAMDYYEESTNSILAGFCYDGSHTNDPSQVEYNSNSHNGTAKTCEENGCVEFYV